MDAVPAAGQANARSERRLAAVVFTDVVGYSALMHADEAATIPRVRADLDRMRALCAEHGGEFLNSMGDGLMLAFDSAVSAVEFAMQVQREFASRDEPPDAPTRLRHRIGIHVGDVSRTPEGQLTGDGVNVAARLEGAAPTGGVCISQAVRDLVRGKVSLDAHFAGARQFKNIAEPVAIWQWHPGGSDALAAQAAATPAAGWNRRRVLLAAGGGGVLASCVAAGAYLIARSRQSQDGVKSLAVLPFANLSEDKDAAYFADGIHEDLLTQLALLGDLKVVSRTSVMEYRNTVKKVPQIGSELNVGALVEGSVRKSGNTVRVTAQLVDARADKHIWAANYDRDLRDVFKVQNDLAKEIAGSLNVSLTAAEEKRLARAPSQNLQAYEYYLRYQQMVRDAAGTVRWISSIRERIALLEKAVEADPGFALAWSRLASERAKARHYGMVDDREREVGLARQAISRAKAIAPDDPQVKIDEAATLLHGVDDPKGASLIYEDVLRAAPYNIDAMQGLAEVMESLGQVPAQVRLLERALAVDARHGASMTRLAIEYGEFRHYDRTLQLRQQLIDMAPDDVDRHAGYQQWNFWKTGKWDDFDRWRATLAQGTEKRVVRVRNLDASRAIARRDFAEVHRLIDVDSEDWKFDASGTPALVRAGLHALHALAWHAQGDATKASQVARQALAAYEASVKEHKDYPSWSDIAQMHALLGHREAALQAYAANVAAEQAEGKAWPIEWAKRRRVEIDALLGDTDSALTGFARLSRLPGFQIHEMPVYLPLARLWDHPRFIALVSDPASNAPLPLDTPIGDGSR